MAKKENRINLALECKECSRRNYTTTKNKRNTEGKLEIKKHCSHCKSHTVHKETKV